MSVSNSSYLGHEITYNSDDELVVHSWAGGSRHGGGTGGGGGGGGTTGGTPSGTLVTTPGSNLEFNLIWDSSVSSAPSGFQQAVVNAAKYYESIFNSPTT